MVTSHSQKSQDEDKEENKVNCGASSFSFCQNEAMANVTCDETNFLGSPENKSRVNSKTIHDLTTVLSDFKVDQINQRPETRQIETNQLVFENSELLSS